MSEGKLLIIEDDTKICNFMSMALKAKGYEVMIANNGNSGILLFCTNNPDIVLLDLGLPDIDGIKVIKKIRKVSQTPILVISAREDENDKIVALDLGANDYVTKPFSMGEVFARIRVLQRYIKHDEEIEKVYTFDNLIINTDKRQVTIDNQEIHLTPIEYKLLILLASQRGKVVTYSQIAKNVFGYEGIEDSKNIRVHMASLRRKIEKDTASPKFIITEIKIGYRFTN